MARLKDFKQSLLKKYFVRWHMSAILAATIASGMLLDKLFLKLGFHVMGWRYALSVLGAYACFFLFVRLWVWYAAGVKPKIDLPDLPDIAIDTIPTPRIPTAQGFQAFHGGDSGGGGATDLFDKVSVPDVDLSLDIDGDEGVWILIILAVLVAVLCGAGMYLIWMAPEILPEIALEAAIGAGMVHALKTPESGWAGKLLYKTWIPLAIVLVSAFAAGHFIQQSCPTATHVRQALACAAEPESITMPQ